MRNSKTDGYTYIKGIILVVERGQAKVCTLCSKQFGLMNKEHQCKRCKRPVCEKCSPGKSLSHDDNKMHRICNYCRDEMERLRIFLEEYKICYMVNTISNEWLKTFGMTQSQANSEYYDEQLQCKQSTDVSEYNTYKNQIQQVFKEIQVGQNYSLKNFFIQCLKNNSKERVFEAVEAVLDVFLKKYPQVGYQPDLVIVTLFLLFFANVPSTYALLKIIYLRIMPTYLSNRSLRLKPYDFKEEIQQIMNVNARMNKPISQEFLENKLYRYIVTLTVNMFLFETTFFIINEMFTSNEPYQTFLKQLALCLNMTNSEIIQMGTNYNYGELTLLRSAQSNKLMTVAMKARSMSITLVDYQSTNNNNHNASKEVVVVEDLRDSQLVSLQGEVSLQKLTQDALILQIENLKHQVQQGQDELIRQQQHSHNLDEEIRQLKDLNSELRIQLSTNSTDDQNPLLQQAIDQVRNSSERAQLENQQNLKRIEELNNLVIKLQDTIRKQAEQNEELKQQTNLLKKVDTKYNLSNITMDPIYLQDVKDMKSDLDLVKRRLFDTFLQTIESLQNELKFKEIELQLRKDEVISNPVITKLHQEMMQLEQELSDANLENVELRRQLNRVSIQTNLHKRTAPQTQEESIGCSPSNKDCTIF